MIPVYWNGDYIISPLGVGSEANMDSLLLGQMGVKKQYQPTLYPSPFCGALIEDVMGEAISTDLSGVYTRLECLLISAIDSLVKQYSIPLGEETLVILSTTKGNIGLLNNSEQDRFPEERVYLSVMAQQIRQYFKLKDKIIVLSNACISGALAVSVARQMLQSGKYKQAIVVGGDELSNFILSGFNAFQAMSDEPCRPYDSDRKGINLGEAVVAAYLSVEEQESSVEILGVGSYNDANHISGPSRTGEGLYRSIQSALAEAKMTTVDFISAHGTATLYNDEMESIALGRSSLNHIPLHSLKGYYGHTLGASGLLETAIACRSLCQGVLVPSPGYENPGTSYPLEIIQRVQTENVHSFIKMASGFGGSNIATVFRKVS